MKYYPPMPRPNTLQGSEKPDKQGSAPINNQDVVNILAKALISRREVLKEYEEEEEEEDLTDWFV